MLNMITLWSLGGPEIVLIVLVILLILVVKKFLN